MAELSAIWHLWRLLAHRLSQTRHDQRGYTTETVIVTALLVALAVAGVSIIAAKVISKANSINP